MYPHFYSMSGSVDRAWEISNMSKNVYWFDGQRAEIVLLLCQDEGRRDEYCVRAI